MSLNIIDLDQYIYKPATSIKRESTTSTPAKRTHSTGNAAANLLHQFIDPSIDNHNNNNNNTPNKKQIQLSGNGSDIKSASRKQSSSSKKKQKLIDTLQSYNPSPAWTNILAGIIEMRKYRNAVVDTMGAESNALPNIEPNIFRFQTLVSLLLSSQTPDTVTSHACKQLQSNLSNGLTIQSILNTDVNTIDSLISKVGFHRRKAQYLIQTCHILHEQYNDDIPNNVDELMKLPGIGMVIYV